MTDPKKTTSTFDKVLLTLIGAALAFGAGGAWEVAGTIRDVELRVYPELSSISTALQDLQREVREVKEWVKSKVASNEALGALERRVGRLEDK
jgi:hypothetical protein